jgi:putative redox protein
MENPTLGDAVVETRIGLLDHIERELEFDGELTEEQRARLMDIAERCPVHRTLNSEVPISTTEKAQDKAGG